jgi:site-specific DNA-methyltransferase (adenine-specific)
MNTNTSAMLSTGVLYYGDNLDILRNRDYFPDECVDLVYLDPPFNSQANYNILFREASGAPSEAQIQAFSDTWHWDMSAERTYEDIISSARPEVAEMISALRRFIGNNDMMAYLVMMTPRLMELHRVLKPTGSIYLHCDPTASHYLKVVMDTIFGKQSFRNEIIWLRSSPKSHVSRRFPNAHDVILLYAKSERAKFSLTYTPHREEYVDKFYRFVEPETGRRYRLDNLANPNKNRPNLTYEFKGVTRVWRWTRERMEQADREGRIVWSPGRVPAYKRYLDEMPGTPATNVWTDIQPIQSHAAERLGYDTQKPLALLERIIQASSNEGDVVLDPFCGCGTAVVAAQKLKRRWIGIDVTHLAINIMKNRLKGHFGEDLEFEVVGEPVDLGGARALAAQDRYQFQWWALSLIEAMPVAEKKKGADRGIDGLITFVDGQRGKTNRAVVQVKSGGVRVGDIRDLKGVLDREQAAIGIFITLEPRTRRLREDAVSGGVDRSELWERDFPRVQILTVEEILAGKQPELPTTKSGYARAQRIEAEQGEQLGLES